MIIDESMGNLYSKRYKQNEQNIQNRERQAEEFKRKYLEILLQEEIKKAQFVDELTILLKTSENPDLIDKTKEINNTEFFDKFMNLLDASGNIYLSDKIHDLVGKTPIKAALKISKDIVACIPHKGIKIGASIGLEIAEKFYNVYDKFDYKAEANLIKNSLCGARNIDISNVEINKDDGIIKNVAENMIEYVQDFKFLDYLCNDWKEPSNEPFVNQEHLEIAIDMIQEGY